MSRSIEARAGFILAGFLLLEGAWALLNFLLNPMVFLRFMGFAPGLLGAPLGWIVAGLVTALFVYHSARMPSVRANLVTISWLKLLSLPMALAAGLLEEAVFRKALMDSLQHAGYGIALQVLASGLAFGAAHGVWGIFGRNWRAAVGATVATGILGSLLALAYVAGGRSVACCVTAHFVMDALCEPGLVLAVLRGEMGRSLTAVA